MNLPQGDGYSRFAADYHWLYSDHVLSGVPFVEEFRWALDPLSPEARILDCACGIGVHALALSRNGFSVQGTDGCPEMVEQAIQRGELEGASVDFAVSPWHELAAAHPREFDIVFCCGNSIGHCPSESAMLSSLHGMHGALKEDGQLVLNSRNWERLWLDKPRFNTLGLRVRSGVRCIPLYVWNIPTSWDEELVIEVVMIFDADGHVSSRSHRIAYFPFRHQDLLERLKRSGFRRIETDYSERCEIYTVTAHAC